jgi:hypothetical protein
MPAELPGFYFDSAQNKYFRIQANHVAPRDSPYSAQAVQARKHRERSEPSIRTDSFTKAKYFETTSGSILQRRMGRGATSSDIVNDAWANDMTGQHIYGGLQGEVFAVEPMTRVLYTLAHSRSLWKRAFGFYLDAKDLNEPEFDERGYQKSPDRTRFPNGALTPLLPKVRSIDFIDPKTIIVLGSADEDSPTIQISKQLCSSMERYPSWSCVQIPASDEGGVWNLRLAPGHSRMALTGDDGLALVDLPRLVASSRPHQFNFIHDDHTLGQWRPPGSSEMSQELMKTAWKDDNVLLTGNRQGQMWLLDSRLLGINQHISGAVLRAQVPSAISQIHATPREGVLVWTLEGGSLFDLRYIKAQAQPPRRENPKRRKHNHAKSYTVPAITFDVPHSHQQHRYGLGWAYDDEMGVIASAGTDLFKTHTVGLWDVKTGKRLDRPGGELNKTQFVEPITCLQMVDLQQSGGCKSLLMACGGRDIDAWEV